MRFLRLDLRAFGPFADAPPIDFSGLPRGLHLIHGPNEAGKSSALRAIRCLLFGYPMRLNDDHRHAYKDLRVGATLQSEQKTEIAFLRRKGDVRTIRTLDDDGFIADETLELFLGGLDRSKFDEFFAMDHAELVVGGKAMANGQGNLGSMLFAAGSGLAGIDSIRRSLEAEQDELFKPAGRNPTINATLVQIREARDFSEKSMLATDQWVGLDARLAAELANKAKIDAQVRQVEAEKRRLERLRDALPVLEKIDRVVSDLAGYANAPMLADDFAERRHAAVAARYAGAKSADAAEAALEEVAQALQELGPRERVLDEADAIREARDDLGFYRKALLDRPVDESRLVRLQSDARALLAELRPGTSLDDADSLPISAALKGRVQGLAQELAGLQAGLSTADNEVAKLVAVNPGVDRKGVAMDAQRQAEALDQAIRQGQARGDREAQLTATIDELAKLEQQASVDLRALPLWSGSLEALEALAIPSNTTIDKFEIQFRAADETLDRLKLELAKHEAEVAKLDRLTERQRESGPVPTEQELATKRTARDGAWRQIRRAWLDREPTENPSQLAEAFESAVKGSDELADRLRREADAVAEQVRNQWRRRELSDLIAQATRDREQAGSDRDRVIEAWRETWKPIDIDPLTPREMKDWVAFSRAELVRQAKVLREKRHERDRQTEKISEFKAEIGQHLRSLGEPSEMPGESLSALLARANAAVSRVNASLRLQEARTIREQAEAALTEFKARWARAVEPLGLESDATPGQALAVIGRFDTLASILGELAETRKKVENHTRVESRFRSLIGSLLDRLAIEPASTSLEATARDLDDRLKRAGQAEARREELLKRKAKEEEKRDNAREEVDRAEASLEALRAEARCKSDEELVEALQISDAIKERRKDLRSLEDQLATLGGPIGMGKLREQAEEVDGETIELQISELAEMLTPLEADRDRVAEEIGRCRQQLEAMNGGPAAADAQQVVEEHLARLAGEVEKYARLKLASAILREAVERYRKEHQGPVLDRAGDLFASLTVGSFRGLLTDLDVKGEPVLLGVRANGSTLKVEGMSEGTADQLYLALRLASLQTYLDDHEPMPLVVDDILVNFDNARSLAALQALAELSQRTQVLFFTHHEHLIEIAQTHLPAETFRVHHLTYPPVSVEGATAEPVKSKRKKKIATPAIEE